MSAAMLRLDLQTKLPAVIDTLQTLWKTPDHDGLSREVLVSAYDALGKLYKELDVLISAIQEAEVAPLVKKYSIRQAAQVEGGQPL